MLLGKLYKEDNLTIINVCMDFSIRFDSEGLVLNFNIY